jgi:hypothetical protein
VNGIAGGCYCVRGAILRKIWMPAGLLGEDGFLAAMLRTELFTSADNPRRIVRAEEAAVIYEPETSIRGIYAHSRRLMMGTAMNAVLYDDLWKSAGSVGAGELIRQRTASDPQWAYRLIREYVLASGWWVIPWQIVFRRLGSVKSLPPARLLVHLPVAVAATLFEVAVSLSANRRLKSLHFSW